MFEIFKKMAEKQFGLQKEAFDLSIIELIPGFSFLTMWTLEEEDMNQLCNKNLEIQLVKKEFLGSSVKDTIFVNLYPFRTTRTVSDEYTFKNKKCNICLKILCEMGCLDFTSFISIEKCVICPKKK